MGIKYSIFRGMRYVDQLARHAFNFAAHMNDRLVFRDFVPVLKHSVWLKEISMLKFGLLIGEIVCFAGVNEELVNILTSQFIDNVLLSLLPLYF